MTKSNGTETEASQRRLADIGDSSILFFAGLYLLVISFILPAALFGCVAGVFWIDAISGQAGILIGSFTGLFIGSVLWIFSKVTFNFVIEIILYFYTAVVYLMVFSASLILLLSFFRLLLCLE